MKKFNFLFLTICLSLVFLTGCPKKVEPTKTCIDRIVVCKKDFNTTSETIMNDLSISKSDISTKFYPLEKALNVELNAILKKARDNNGKPYESCDNEVDLFCNDILQYKNIYEKSKNVTTTTTIN